MSNYKNRDYLFITHHEERGVSLYFGIENEKIFALGEEMNNIREDAYMNGFN